MSGGERLLEVKTTNGSARTPFFLTRRNSIRQGAGRKSSASIASTYSRGSPAYSPLRRHWMLPFSCCRSCGERGRGPVILLVLYLIAVIVFT